MKILIHTIETDGLQTRAGMNGDVVSDYADKRHALEIAWENRNAVFGGEPSKRQLAEACAVSDFLAWDFINERKVVENTTSDFDLIEERSERSTTHEERSTTHDVDRFGLEIPEHLVRALKSKALAKMSRQIRALAAEITRRQEARDYVFAKISQPTMIALQNAANDLKLETPYCVCPDCKGEGCRACGKIGLQTTKMEYERNPSEVRAR